MDESPFEVEAFLADWLETLPGLKDPVGQVPGIASGVFPIIIPSSRALPAVTYRRTKTNRTLTTGAPQHTGPCVIAVAGFEFRCWALSDKNGYKQALALARIIRLGIHGIKAQKDGHDVRLITLENEYDDDTPVVFRDDAREVVAINRVLQTNVTYAETVKTRGQGQVP